jgi:hypothetical protein
MSSSSNLTLSAWVNMTSTDTWGSEIISLGNCVGLRQQGTNMDGYFYNGGNWYFINSPTNAMGTGWRYVAFTFNNAAHLQTVYVDGIAVGSSNFSSSISYAGQGANTIIGKHATGAAGYNYFGTMDEVRVANAVRPAGWIVTEYKNQNSPTTFYSVGSTQSAPPTTLSITMVNGGANPTAGSGFSVIVQAQDAGGSPRNVTADTTVALSLNTGSGTLSGTLTGIITAGNNSVTVSGVTYTKAESGVSVAAACTGGSILTADNSSSFTVNPGAYNRLQLLMQGETAAPGTATGKTSSPVAQTVGTAFAVTVNSVDANWNPIGTNDTVAITSSDGLANLPANAALVAGSKTFNVTLNSAGSATVIASDVTHVGIIANTGSFTAVNVGSQTITFPSPGNQTYGVNPITLGATASSGLALSYSVTSGPATVAGNALTITGVGMVTVQASQAGNANWNAASPVSQSIVVAQKTLTVSSGLTANNKVYDGMTTATISSNAVALSGVIAVDTSNVFSSTNGYAATFGAVAEGNGKTVSVGGLTLTGSAAANYTLTQPSLSANITAATVTVTSGINANNKVYDGTTTATINSNSVALSGVIAGDLANVKLSTNGYDAAFAGAAAGNGKTVAVVGLTLTGSAATNYALTQPGLNANVTVAITSNSLASSLNPALPGSNITFTTALSVVAPGNGTPIGNIIFKDGTSAFGTNTLNGSAVATYSTTALSHGGHTITAEYAGNGNFFGSTNGISQVVNAPPVAAGDALQRALNSGLKVRIATLLANDTDPDGDVLTFISVSATSVSGGTSVVQGNWIYYSSPAGYTNADSFSYIIADTGGLQATGMVSVTILADNTPAQNIGSIVNLGSNSSRISFNAIPGRTYPIQYATNLVTPAWLPLGMAAADAFGKSSYTDSPATNAPPRFYRLTFP